MSNTLAISFLDNSTPSLINNGARNIRRVNKTTDWAANSFVPSQSITSEIESSITLQKTKEQKIDELLCLKQPIIDKRNSILSNPFKYLNPLNSKKLRALNIKLDKLELEIYQIETEDRVTRSDLHEILRFAEERLEKQTLYLQNEIEHKLNYPSP